MAKAYFVADNDTMNKLAGEDVGLSVADFLAANTDWYRHPEEAEAICNDTFAGGVMKYTPYGTVEALEQEETNFIPPTPPFKPW